MINLISSLINLPPLTRRLILMSSEWLILFICFKTSFSLYFIDDKNNLISEPNLAGLYILFPFLGILIYFISRQYRVKTSYVDKYFGFQLCMNNLMIILAIFFINDFYYKLNLSFPLLSALYFKLCTVLVGYRFFISYLLSKHELGQITKKIKIAIYGTESTAVQLALALQLNAKYSILYFINDNKDIQGRTLLGIKVINLEDLQVKKLKIDQILLASPSISKEKRKNLLSIVDRENISIREVPSIESTINLKYGNSISLEDLLERETVIESINIDRFEGIRKQNLIVTGAGGSIGSELSKQLINLKPAKILLLDNSEISLYNLQKEISKASNDVELLFVLGDAQDSKFINNLLKKNDVSVVFHAAAYKHVPLVESNPLQGLLNNIVSTKSMCLASLNSNVKEFVLISSDKAVRPTSVMGASKRLSELIVQAFFLDNKKNNSIQNTCFSMVRFGNVLGSSGSVVPLFNEQINRGGPITITDKKMTRYFMTISEAASLVIQASRLSEGGEVFLLDMGKPLKIYDLAKKMITLSGNTLKDEKNSSGSIAIELTGIRQGEKLFEELLIDNNAVSTKHPMIYKSKEKPVDPEDFWPKLQELEKFINDNNEEKSFQTLSKILPEWRNSK